MAKSGYIQIIRKCNQKCIACSNPSNEREITLAGAKKEIGALKRSGHIEVILTGGEPTLHPKLPEMITYAVKNKIPPRVITNGQKISNINYLKKLQKAGLQNLNLSIYSNIAKIQHKLSKKKDSLKNIKKSLDNISKVGIEANLNILINKYNSNNLSGLVSWIIKKYPAINHFVFNNIDPFMNRVSKNPDVVARFNDFELELHLALEMLQKNKKTFRVERVPLCYMTDYEYASTETRKIVKNEVRTIFFLDEKGEHTNNQWKHQQSESCKVCFLQKICAGADTRGGYYKKEELYPVFIDPQKIIEKVNKKN